MWLSSVENTFFVVLQNFIADPVGFDGRILFVSCSEGPVIDLKLLYKCMNLCVMLYY